LRLHDTAGSRKLISSRWQGPIVPRECCIY
jgi:hypothetical protein